MLEGKDLILATKKYATEDRRKSWRLLLVTVFVMCFFYFGAIFPSYPIIQFSSGILAGLTSVRFFIIYHDYLHKSILQNSVLAKLIFTLYGFFILAPTSIWKRSHDYHHANNCKLYTSSIGSFPLITKKDFLKSSKVERGIYLFIRHPLTILFGYIFAFLWGMCIRTLIKSFSKHWDSFVAIVFHYSIAFIIYNFFGLSTVLIGFFLPGFIKSAIGSYLFYAQHNYPGAQHKNKEEWSYDFAALHSSSFLKTNRIMNWFTGNIGYHHIHHMNARIPFYKLPQVYKEMPEFHNSVTTSFSIKDIYGCLKVKVWDNEAKKMISLKEVYS